MDTEGPCEFHVLRQAYPSAVVSDVLRAIARLATDLSRIPFESLVLIDSVEWDCKTAVLRSLKVA